MSSKTKGRKSYQQGSFGLATFMRGDAEAGEGGAEDKGHAERKGDIRVTTSTTIMATDTHGSSENAWGVSRDDMNESRHDLHSRLSKETLGVHGPLAVPASFLAKDGPSRHSDST
jgi:hypothetical protein